MGSAAVKIAPSGGRGQEQALDKFNLDDLADKNYVPRRNSRHQIVELDAAGKAVIPGTKYTWLHGKRSPLGGKREGIAGGSPTSAFNVMAEVVVDAMARETNEPREKIHEWFMAFGRIAQAMVLEGTPVGIPYVGMLVVNRWKLPPEKFQAKVAAYKKAEKQMIAAMKAGRDDDPIFKEWFKQHKTPQHKLNACQGTIAILSPILNYVRFVTTPMMRGMFFHNCAYRGYWKDIVREEFQSRIAQKKGKRDENRKPHLRARIRRARAGIFLPQERPDAQQLIHPPKRYVIQ